MIRTSDRPGGPERRLPRIAGGLIGALWLVVAVAASQDRQASAAPPAVAAPALPAAAVETAPLPARLQRGEPRTIEDLRRLEARTVALVARVRLATVAVGGASGVLVKDGIVLTAGHVSRNLSGGRGTPQVVLHDGRRVAARVLGQNGRLDAGLLQVLDAGDLPHLAMGRSGSVLPGTWCLMLGFPSGTASRGAASARLGRVLEVRADGTLVTDCAMQAGDSGGPLVDLQGRLIGINSRITGDLATNVHVQIDAFRAHWDALVAGERVRGGTGPLRGVRSRRDARSAAPVREAFGPVVDRARRGTVEVLGNGERLALGAIVHARGYVITKASALAGARSLDCRLPGRREPVPATRVATRDRDDLALLRIDAGDLVPVEWASEAAIEPGRWLASPGLDVAPLAWGVASVPVHERPAGVHLGARMRIRRAGVEIRSTEPGSPAARAGLEAGDVIVSLDGEAMDHGRDWRRALARRQPGERIRLVVRRGSENRTVVATLERSRSGGAAHRQQNLWGALSPVRSGFSPVLQHDTVLAPDACGGPLVDLDGRAVGLNIARASRVETLALPAAAVEAAIRDLLERSL